MSYFPQTSPASTVASMRSFATYASRMNWGTSVRGAVASPVTQTTGSFTVPAVGGSVTVSVSSTTNFIAGDYVMVGTRSMTLTAPVHSSTGPGSLFFEGRYFQGRAPGASLGPAGYHLLGQGGESTTVTLTPFNLPNFVDVTSVSISVTDRAQIPSGGIIHLTNYAGVYRVTTVNPSSLLLTLVIAGDLREGMTCVQDISGSDTGAYVTQFYPLGYVPKGMILTYTSAFAAVVSVSGGGASPTTGPAISLGYTPNPYTSGPTTRMGDYIDDQAQKAGWQVVAGGAYSLLGPDPDTSQERTTPMDGMAFGVRVNTPQSTSMVVDVSLRGLLVPMV